MNAKKIMGAVLVALLALTAFAGVGAAATTVGGTVFVNQALPAGLEALTWTDSNGAVVSPLYDPLDQNKVYFPTAGVYTTEVTDDAQGTLSGSPNAEVKITLTVKAPEAIISGVAGSGTDAYTFIPGTFYIGGGNAKVEVLSGATFQAITGMTIFLTKPNGEEKSYNNGNDIATILNDQSNKPAAGEYSITVVYGIGNFVNGTSVDQISTKPVSFKVAEAGDVAISASVDQALKGETFKITITGQPGVVYWVTFEENDFKAVELGQKSLLDTNYAYLDSAKPSNGFKFTMPNTGKVEVVVASANNAGDSGKITVQEENEPENKASVTVKFNKGKIYDVKTDAASYFVGDKVTITGVTTAGEITNLTIKGTNFEAKMSKGITQKFPTVEYGNDVAKTFEFELETADILNQKTNFAGKKMDVGTYTVKIETASAEATVSVTLKQPFISIVEAPEVIVQDTEAEFVINAEAVKTDEIEYYLFGTNYFKTGKGIQDEDVKTHYIVKLEEEDTINMSAGQYFAVFQHPMYDGYFNIEATDDGNFYLNTSNDALPDGSFLFSFDVRQTANAAQALCDALDSQNIDDMYVKYSFFVVGEDESFTISEIPETVAQGSTFTVSGVSTANAGKTVQVEMISTAFAAVPKETVGSAAFIVVTTQVADDGTWEVTMDTSDLNVDEYSLKVACGDDTWKNTKVNVVEAADEPVTPPTDDPKPVDPVDPVDPPKTPGFGALAALAGLGAVAVLLLRRE